MHIWNGNKKDETVSVLSSVWAHPLGYRPVALKFRPWELVFAGQVETVVGGASAANTPEALTCVLVRLEPQVLSTLHYHYCSRLRGSQLWSQKKMSA